MKKIRTWFMNRFLPMWAKETVLQENRRLRAEVDRLGEELARKDAYISGLMAGMKCQRRIIINTAEEKK